MVAASCCVTVMSRSVDGELFGVFASRKKIVIYLIANFAR